MCRVFYKYFLITSTSFMATGGLYFACLTRWLWPSPINDYGHDDWRIVPETIGFVLFVIGLPVVIRARPKELLIFALILILPSAIITSMLVVQLLEKHAELDLSDFFLTTVATLLALIEMHIFLFVRSIKQRKEQAHHHHHKQQSVAVGQRNHHYHYHPGANKAKMAYYTPPASNQQITEL